MFTPRSVTAKSTELRHEQVGVVGPNIEMSRKAASSSLFPAAMLELEGRIHAKQSDDWAGICVLECFGSKGLWGHGQEDKLKC